MDSLDKSFQYASSEVNILLVDISGVDSCRDSLSRFEFRWVILSGLFFFIEARREGQSPDTNYLGKWHVYHQIIQANKEIEPEK